MKRILVKNSIVEVTKELGDNFKENGGHIIISATPKDGGKTSIRLGIQNEEFLNNAISEVSDRDYPPFHTLNFLTDAINLLSKMRREIRIKNIESAQSN